ncbi:hypothetical protein O6H91_06G147000 [Diphasiastrum complanatum]|uniref:Uncharacterized protein n=1 Tax=Diphasiastrum complanatum TaxID=34168 RepID=A0ACC2DKP5_DIPCM|nr:hypothetical protein O6H91_06G147000 [Diphasiastrum complanatum]
MFPSLCRLDFLLCCKAVSHSADVEKVMSPPGALILLEFENWRYGPYACNLPYTKAWTSRNSSMHKVVQKLGNSAPKWMKLSSMRVAVDRCGGCNARSFCWCSNA